MTGIIGSLRRMGIALGAFVAAALSVGLVGSMALPILGVPLTAFFIGFSGIGSWSSLAMTAILGWLIYRDILRHDGSRQQVHRRHWR
jgi:hypothetical protein